MRTICSYFKARPHLVLTALYAMVIIMASHNHEPWRDEVHALSLATESNSIFDLFSNLKNDGHPALWHLILYSGYHLMHNTLVLKIASILIAILAIYLFLLSSPFNWIQKTLFIFGYFPIYEYSIINRNYGISMLFIFLFCTIYKHRFKKILILSLILFLLCQTNVHSLIIVISISLSLFVEMCLKGYFIRHNAENKNECVLGFIIILMGIFLSILQIYPDNTSIIANDLPSFDFILKSALSVVILPGREFRAALGFENVLFVSSILWLSYLYLLRKPYILLIFFLSVVGIALFFKIIHPGYLRHQGFLLVMIVAMYWLDAVNDEAVSNFPYSLKQIMDIFSVNWKSLITLLLFMQVCMGAPAIKEEIKKDFSSSKKLAELIETNPSLREAIIIGEPDFYVEALPYYISNRIYIPREARFGKAVKWAFLNKQEYSLHELLYTANNLREKFRKPILIVIGHPLKKEGPFTIKYIYRKEFIYNRDSLESLYMKTIRIASFQQSISGENYEVFLLN